MLRGNVVVSCMVQALTPKTDTLLEQLEDPGARVRKPLSSWSGRSTLDRLILSA